MVAMAVTTEGGLGLLRAAVDELVSADLARLDDHELVAFAREFEALRNRLSQVDHQIVAAIDATGLADRMVARGPAGVLNVVLNVSKTEARRRVTGATSLAQHRTMTGEPVAAKHPALAEREAAGLLGREHCVIALRCLETLADRFGASPAVVDDADVTLARYAPDLDPDGFRSVAQHIIDVEYPGGLLPDDAQVETAREVQLRARSDGSYRLSGTLTGEAGVTLARCWTPSVGPDPQRGRQQKPPEGLILHRPT